MDRGPILIIVNPTSGRHRALRTVQQVAAYLERRGHRVVIRHTRASGDAERRTREACLSEDDRPSCVVACGGDGTVQEIANALAPLKESLGDRRPVMGIAPAGRCNDFARALGISPDPVEIAGVLANGEPRAIDLGRVNGRYFCTVATFGVDAEVSSYVDRMRMPLRGTLAYIYGALRVLCKYRNHNVRLRGDFGVIEQGIFLASTANTSSYGGAIPIVPCADPADGELDLCVIDHVSRLRGFTIIPMVMTRRHTSNAGVRFIRTKRFSIDSDKPMEVWADGERIAETPVEIEIAPGSIDVLLPSSGSAPVSETEYKSPK